MMRILFVLLLVLFQVLANSHAYEYQDLVAEASAHDEVNGQIVEHVDTDEPDTVLGYLFKEALNQIGGTANQAANLLHQNDDDENDENNNRPKKEIPKEESKIFELPKAPAELVPDDPVFNFIVGASVLALVAQAFVTPFGKVTIANGRKKRQVNDG